MFQDILDYFNLTQLLIWFLGIVGTALIVWYRKTIKKWKDGFNDITAGLKKIPTLESRMDKLKDDIGVIRHQVLPNGGSSISDAVARTEVALSETRAQISLLSATILAENDSDDAVGRFYCDPDGGNTYVNQRYARWLKVGKPELMGWNFLNFTHPEDVKQVQNLWNECRKHSRQYRNVHRMVASDGEVIRVKVTATPVPENSEVLRWVGTMWKLDVPDEDED